MADKRVFHLTHSMARARAVECVKAAPDGYSVTIKEPGRSLKQNDLMWPLLECFSEQKQWNVNGQRCKLSEEDWKDILTAAYARENLRFADGLNGGVVLLGVRTSKMGRRWFSGLLEFIFSTAAEMGVNLDPHRHLRPKEVAA